MAFDEFFINNFNDIPFELDFGGKLTSSVNRIKATIDKYIVDIHDFRKTNQFARCKVLLTILHLAWVVSESTTLIEPLIAVIKIVDFVWKLCVYESAQRYKFRVITS